ncbi:kelch motif family protein [Penaeus vannamei]|uniref:Kelch motif family protein n=1 Tax=Penaeus vannamei TaxID=6689 RepID=A0A3R7QLK3_PENVA|nr:kelch motif family protein [Penaeus vannamei]
MSFKFMDILSHVTKGLGMIMNMQDTQRIAGRNQGHVDEALQIIRRQQQNIEQLMKDRQQQEMVMERLLNLFEKMDRDATGPSAIDSNRMQNASLVLSFPEDSQDSNSIIQSLYWTLHNALNNDEDNHSGVDSFGHDSVHSFEQVPVILRCDRCSDKFNQKERQPIVLTGCGHTVCRMCIQKERRQDRFMCSKCSIISRDLEDLPVNRTLYEILEEVRLAGRTRSSLRLPLLTNFCIPVFTD